MGNLKKKAPVRTADEISKLVLGDVASGIDAAGLLRDIIEEIGGPREYARMIAKQLRATDDGSQTKQRLLDMTIRLLTFCTSHELAKQVEPSQMSDADIERMSLSMIARARLGNADGTSGAGTQGSGPPPG